MSKHEMNVVNDENFIALLAEAEALGPQYVKALKEQKQRQQKEIDAHT